MVKIIDIKTRGAYAPPAPIAAPEPGERGYCVALAARDGTPQVLAHVYGDSRAVTRARAALMAEAPDMAALLADIFALVARNPTAQGFTADFFAPGGPMQAMAEILKRIETYKQD